MGTTVKSTPRPPGNSSGHTWSRSPRMGSGRVSTDASPPASETRHKPVLLPNVAKTMLPSWPQLAPRGVPSRLHRVIAGPPEIGIFLRP
jgi:hypothetical protein